MLLFSRFNFQLVVVVKFYAKFVTLRSIFIWTCVHYCEQMWSFHATVP
jgi:hypothetical protein